MRLGKTGVIGRFRPLHIGGEVMLQYICENAEEVVIGIGSSNRYDRRNPFTPEETKDMVDVVLEEYDNYQVEMIPDFAHKEEHKDGERWKEYVLREFGELDYFISGNEYVQELLEDAYEVIHPGEVIPEGDQVYMKGAIVRCEMARGGVWGRCVPDPVEEYIIENGLDERFREEFGLETLQACADTEYWKPDDEETEKLHTQGATR